MSSKTRVASPSEVYEQYMAAFADKDISAILENYSDDSVIITNRGSFHGLDDIESMIMEQFKEFSQEGIEFEIDEQTVDGDVVYHAWHAETPDSVYEFGTETYIIRDGVIETQTGGMLVRPKD